MTVGMRQQVNIPGMGRAGGVMNTSRVMARISPARWKDLEAKVEYPLLKMIRSKVSDFGVFQTLEYLHRLYC